MMKEWIKLDVFVYDISIYIKKKEKNRKTTILKKSLNLKAKMGK